MILQLLNERSGKFKFHEECFKSQLLKHAEIVIFYVSSFSQIRNIVKETGSYKSVEVTFLRLWKYWKNYNFHGILVLFAQVKII